MVHSLKNKKIKNKKLKKQENQDIFQNKLDKACFQHDMAYWGFKYLNRRTIVDKVLRDKACNFAKNPKYDGYQGGLASMVYKFFDKKMSSGTVNNDIISNKELAEELHKTIIRKFKKRKVQSSFTDSIWAEI